MKLEEIGFYSLSDERAKNASLTSQMKRCEMIITEYCNFKCPYCRGLKSEIYGNRKHKQLSLEEVKQNIDYWCEGEPLENIRFSGGEPTLHPNIKEIVKYSKEKGIKRIAISTNGSNKTELYKELIELGVNDVSVSLDACCAEDGDKMSGGVKGSWDIVVNNIKEISKLTYVTVGVVLNELNIDSCVDTIRFAHQLGVSDIRIISSAQNNSMIKGLDKVEKEILDCHPILKYRINNFLQGLNVRGIKDTDSHKCALMLDDSVIAGSWVFNCVIHMREGGKPICKVGPNMRKERYDFMQTFDTHKDPICKKNCLDICVSYSNTYKKFH
jgi:MoaA/NifB/PqqE/SkfB family radical SAM enzyme